MTHADTADAIDAIVGITPDSRVAQIRALRPDAAGYAQGSYAALLEPADEAGLGRAERALIALRAALLAPSRAVAAHYRERLQSLGVEATTIAAVEHFPEGGAVSPQLAAILPHVELMTLRPHAAGREALEALEAAGLSARNIVSIAQLVAFVSYQVRLAAGLRLLQEEQQ
ncbi:MAG TPA: CMD domain protein [Roseiflexaceae bacterium]|nr:CMD domain protein [Roseiflexaceae bacterium]HMP42700.1 CMD domain protein [Roseiflexaceae bacterium]